MGSHVPLPPKLEPWERPGLPEPFCSKWKHGRLRPPVNRSPRRRTSDVLFPVLVVVAAVAAVLTSWKAHQLATRQVVPEVLQEQGLIP